MNRIMDRLEKPKEFKLHKGKWTPILDEQDPIRTFWEIYARPLVPDVNTTIDVLMGGDDRSIKDVLLNWARMTASIDLASMDNIGDLNNFMGMVGYNDGNNNNG